MQFNLEALPDDAVYTVCQKASELELLNLTRTSKRVRELCWPLLQERYRTTNNPLLIAASNNLAIILPYIQRVTAELQQVASMTEDEIFWEEPEYQEWERQLAALLIALIKGNFSQLPEVVKVLTTAIIKDNHGGEYWPLIPETIIAQSSHNHYRDLPLILEALYPLVPQFTNDLEELSVDHTIPEYILLQLPAHTDVVMNLQAMIQRLPLPAPPEGREFLYLSQMYSPRVLIELLTMYPDVPHIYINHGHLYRDDVAMLAGMLSDIPRG